MRIFRLEFCFAIFALSAFTFAGQRSAPLRVSVIVRPAAKIEVHSSAAVTIGLTMFPTARALVWLAAGGCATPESPQVLSSSGYFDLAFSDSQAQGRDRVCLETTDGVLRSSAPLPKLVQ